VTLLYLITPENKPKPPRYIRRLLSEKKKHEIWNSFDKYEEYVIPFATKYYLNEEIFCICDDCKFSVKCGETGEKWDNYCKQWKKWIEQLLKNWPKKIDVKIKSTLGTCPRCNNCDQFWNLDFYDDSLFVCCNPNCRALIQRSPFSGKLEFMMEDATKKFPEISSWYGK
jgi:hypothetical protein